MSLLAALTLDLDLTMLPASAMPCRPELLKHRLPHAGHCELLTGPVDEGFALNMERPLLTGDGFSDWMTERTDLATLLSVSGEPSLLSLPSPPTPDLEAMTSLLKKELEQMEDYFLEESLSPDQVAPSTPPSDGNFHFPFGDGFQPLEHHSTPAPLQTLDSSCLELLELYGRDVPPEIPLQGNEVPIPLQRPPTLPPKGDRRQKKRDQNKTAALRYRQRKRAEHEALGDECQALEARNRDLREKAESIEREIQYVKDLLIEVYKARSQRLRTTP
ncbi:cyclic AMP-dependent transcription factor ATF-5 [Eublepharis macularius]|uniref:Cyclic AMP-dependent transcription factor ATF-5 n=1 Tax=Eublepharis macularius TaxID=481883 RepID=A0AA97LC84_EUBMA|nr:cyclic AMP-dependent transcription factor ATF-5 [Eublepharis macularius]